MRLFVDNLTNVDFSYLCPERGLVGETWLASLELTGPLDEQGMVCDFGIVKKHTRNWLDETIDHTLLVPRGHPNVRIKFVGELVEVRLLSITQPFVCTGPRQAFTLIDAPQITPESVASWCANRLRGDFGPGIDRIELRFSAEAIDGPYYHYSHGLKKHRGNCQRIAHGHRSKILIWRDGELHPAAMEHWANLWRDIYVGSEEDVIDDSREVLTFAYASEQGQFRLQIPKARCYLIPTDSTVELIAQHIAERLHQESPEHRFTVKAFEGLAKGAIAEVG